MVGNGVTNWNYDTDPAFIQMGFWHGLYDLDMYNNITANNCTYYNSRFVSSFGAVCDELMDKFQALVAHVNIYDVYGTCYSSGMKNDKFELYASSDMGMVKVGNEIKTYKKTYTAADYTPFLYKSKSAQRRLKELPPCVFGNPIIAYLNTAAVRTALHIPDYVPAWDLCTGNSSFQYTSDPKGSQWIYEEL